MFNLQLFLHNLYYNFTHDGWKAILVTGLLLVPLGLACWRMIEIPAHMSEGEMSELAQPPTTHEPDSKPDDETEGFSIRGRSVSFLTLFNLTRWGPRWFRVHSNRGVGVVGIVASVVLFTCVSIGVLVQTKASTQELNSIESKDVSDDRP